MPKTKTKTKTKNRYCGSKRYLVFAGLPWDDILAGDGRARGGWGDLEDGFDTKTEALKCVRRLRRSTPWGYVVDTETGGLYGCFG